MSPHSSLASPYPCPPSVFVSLSPLLGTWLFWPQTGPGLSVPLRFIVSLCPLPFWSCSTPFAFDSSLKPWLLCLHRLVIFPFLSLLFACVLGASVLPCHWPLLLRFPCLFLFCLFSALSLSLSLLALSLSYVALGCCAWSFWPQTGPDFQRHPHFPLSYLPLPFPGEAFSFFVIQHCSSVVLLAADWSGVSLRWFLTILPTQHCLWPQTGPGAVAL